MNWEYKYQMVLDWYYPARRCWEAEVEFFKSKEELLARKSELEKLYSAWLEDGSLVLSPAKCIGWDEL